jgi:hypothetical protein
MPIDLFEDKDSKVVAKDPQAEKIIGVDEDIVLESILR